MSLWLLVNICSHVISVWEPNVINVTNVITMIVFFSQKEDEIEEYYRQKYADSSTAERFGEGEDMSDEITQQGLLPGVK